MSLSQRRIEIFNILQKNKTIEVNELAKQFDVSTMTIRRDLLIFEKQGLVTLSYGGAYLNKGVSVEPNFSLKSSQVVEYKEAIAIEASKLINDGESIIIDCGTTTLNIMKYIQNKKVTIITNSWPVVSYLQGNPKIKLILAPGEYNEISAGTISSMTIEFYKKIFADKVFISTQGFSLENGATVPSIDNALVKEAILRSAKEKILLVDHTKFGNNYLASHCDISELDCIVTDDKVEEHYLNILKQQCKNVIIAKPHSTRMNNNVEE